MNPDKLESNNLIKFDEQMPLSNNLLKLEHQKDTVDYATLNSLYGTINVKILSENTP